MTSFLDDQLLRELHAVLGDELGDITALFINQLDEQTADIVACHARGDLEALSAIAHGLKGSAGNMGATALAKSAGSIEKLAIAANHGALEPLVSALPELVRQTIAALRASAYAPPG